MKARVIHAADAVAERDLDHATAVVAHETAVLLQEDVGGLIPQKTEILAEIDLEAIKGAGILHHLKGLIQAGQKKAINTVLADQMAVIMTIWLNMVLLSRVQVVMVTGYGLVTLEDHAITRLLSHADAFQMD